MNSCSLIAFRARRPEDLPSLPEEEEEEEEEPRAAVDLALAASSSHEPIAVSSTDKFFAPLRLACESKMPRIMEVALACIQKLIAYGYVQGQVLQVGKVHRTMMDVVMETICACKDQVSTSVALFSPLLN